ncbi:MAG: hypothetical protein U0894_01595 [Pirellulales bacterium]
MGNAMGAYYTGRGLTRVVMVVQVVGTLVNIVLDYVLVFGVSPFPEPDCWGWFSDSHFKTGLWW